jgi:hypothetical protein
MATRRITVVLPTPGAPVSNSTDRAGRSLGSDAISSFQRYSGTQQVNAGSAWALVATYLARVSTTRLARGSNGFNVAAPWRTFAH